MSFFAHPLQNRSGYHIQERVPEWEALIHGSVFPLFSITLDVIFYPSLAAQE